MLKISAEKGTALQAELDIPSSKSISNRVLIIRALCGVQIKIYNLSTADDTKILANALKNINNKNNASTQTIDIGMAGTAFRFLTAYLATKKGNYLLTGAQRIKQRPIKPLVNALKSLGANIAYVEKEGYAPLLIQGKKLKAKNITIDANISSQFISALLLISPSLSADFKIVLNKKISSRPYIQMTLSLMQHFGIQSTFKGNSIVVNKGNYRPKSLFVEADWSSASYFYQCMALADNGEIVLKNYHKNSIQGDAKLVELFKPFGVKTIFEENQIRLQKTKVTLEFFEYNFSNEPDLAQTFMALYVGMGIEGKLSGLESLKIKETNRIAAMNFEINKLGFQLIEEEKGIFLLQKNNKTIEDYIVFNTYNDHRMAMCLAPLALKFGNIFIKNPEVVSKSNPNFWNLLGKLNFKLEK